LAAQRSLPEVAAPGAGFLDVRFTTLLVELIRGIPDSPM
jgi:hypothetical protein